MAAPMVAGALALALGETVPAVNEGCLAELVGQTAKDVSSDAREDLKGRLDTGAFLGAAPDAGNAGCAGGGDNDDDDSEDDDDDEEDDDDDDDDDD